MRFPWLNSTKATYGVTVDVGSGSVGIALIASVARTPVPTIVWSERFHAGIGKSPLSEEAMEREIALLIQQAFDACVKHGIPAMRARDKHGVVQHVQIGVCAPWAHTVAKSVHVKHEQPFPITKAIIDETIANAQRDVHAQFDGQKTELSLATTTAMDVRLDGYDVTDPVGKTARTLTVTHLIDLVRSRVAEIARESAERAFPDAELLLHSFMRLYYAALCATHVEVRNACLIDITNEATEIGIVIDGSLVDTRWFPSGSRSMARSLAASLKLPLDEALAYFGGNDMVISEAHKTAFDKMRDEYIEQLTALFGGCDKLFTVPRTVFLHTDTNLEAYFAEMVERTLEPQGKLETRVHRMTARFYKDIPAGDTALLLSAYVLHQRPYECTWG